jgi:GR25 family glycosyltransferase involved in LPS biosynthesis
MKINDFFDHVFVINLERRPDRAENMTRKLNGLGIEFELLKAHDGMIEHNEWKERENKTDAKEISEHAKACGRNGCASSHLKALKLAKERGYGNILIFEDDVDFVEKFNDKVDKFLTKLPEQWGIMLLAGGRLKLSNQRGHWNEHYAPGVYRISFAYTTHSYAFQSESFDDAIFAAETAAAAYKHFDVYFSTKKANVYSKYHPFIPNINLCAQMADFSDIKNGKGRHGSFFSNELDAVHEVHTLEETKLRNDNLNYGDGK